MLGYSDTDGAECCRKVTCVIRSFSFMNVRGLQLEYRTAFHKGLLMLILMFGGRRKDLELGDLLNIMKIRYQMFRIESCAK